MKAVHNETPVPTAPIKICYTNKENWNFQLQPQLAEVIQVKHDLISFPLLKSDKMRENTRA